MSRSASNAAPERRRSRITLLAIAALCFAPFAAAYIAYFYWQPHEHSNYGDLIAPRVLGDAPLRRLDARPFRLSELRGKWVLLQLDRADCDADCRAKLYAMRQVRLAQGRERDRIERVWLILDDAPLETMLMREYDGTRMLRASRNPIVAEFPPAGAARDHIYLIDPHGNLILRFPKHADPRKMYKDVARLLRASRIG